MTLPMNLVTLPAKLLTLPTRFIDFVGEGRQSDWQGHRFGWARSFFLVDKVEGRVQVTLPTKEISLHQKMTFAHKSGNLKIYRQERFRVCGLGFVG